MIPREGPRSNGGPFENYENSATSQGTDYTNDVPQKPATAKPKKLAAEKQWGADNRAAIVARLKLNPTDKLNLRTFFSILRSFVLSSGAGGKVAQTIKQVSADMHGPGPRQMSKYIKALEDLGAIRTLQLPVSGGVNGRKGKATARSIVFLEEGYEWVAQIDRVGSSNQPPTACESLAGNSTVGSSNQPSLGNTTRQLQIPPSDMNYVSPKKMAGGSTPEENRRPDPDSAATETDRMRLEAALERATHHLYQQAARDLNTVHHPDGLRRKQAHKAQTEWERLIATHNGPQWQLRLQYAPANLIGQAIAAQGQATPALIYQLDDWVKRGQRASS